MSFYVKVKEGEEKTTFVTCSPSDTIKSVRQSYEKLTENECGELMDASHKTVDDSITLTQLDCDLGAVFFKK